jgi:anti-sigma factor RsiW
MKMNKKEILLWKSFDSPLTVEEQRQLQEELEQSEELRALHREATMLRNALQGTEPASFAEGFSDRVMLRLREESKEQAGWESFSITLPQSFRRVAFAGVAALFLLVVYNIAEGNSLAVERLLGKQNVALERAYDPALHLYRDIK